ncbi:SDR family NAD(P)-dependent oxidoreductase [bacterium]|nr:SDR family NAD(P)-dependent oxidoreductase [bacterium]
MKTDLKHKTVFITGASAGIGEACALEFARAGANLIISARRQAKLERLATDLALKYSVEILPLQLDVRDTGAAAKTISELPAAFRNIDILVNNAGLVLGTEKVHETPDLDIDTMIDTNIKGVLNLIRAIVPRMVADNHGHVINISSIAGLEAYPGGGIYCATKHAVTAITKSLRMDLVDTDLRVSAISPGLVNTEFSMVRFKGDVDKASAVYAGLEALVAKDIADAVVYVATSPAHVQIADMVILANKQASATLVHRDL